MQILRVTLQLISFVIVSLWFVEEVIVSVDYQNFMIFNHVKEKKIDYYVELTFALCCPIIFLFRLLCVRLVIEYSPMSLVLFNIFNAEEFIDVIF